MKKILALILTIAFVLSITAACGKEPNEDLIIPVPATPDAAGSEGPGASGTGVASPGEASPGEASPGEASPGNATPTPVPTPEQATDFDAVETPSGKEPKNIKEAMAINSDVIGWIKVPNTNIDYPILYSSSFYYNSHDIYKKSSNNGTIYSYYNMLTHNSIIAGHNMRKAGTMFHELHTLQNNKEDLKKEKNRTFTLDWFSLTKWEVFALYETQDSEPASTLEENIKHLGDKKRTDVQAWIDKQISRSEIDLGVKPSPDDFLMTLITCGDNYDWSEAQSRLYFFLRCTNPPDGAKAMAGRD